MKKKVILFSLMLLGILSTISAQHIAYGYVENDSCVYVMQVAHDTTNIPINWDVINRPEWNRKFYNCQIDWIQANAAALVNLEKDMPVRKKRRLEYLNISSLSLERINEEKFLINSILEFPRLFRRNKVRRYWLVTLDEKNTQYTVSAINKKNLSKIRRRKR